MKKHAVLVFCFCMATIACEDSPAPPANLLAEDIYIDVMVELQLLKSYQHNAKMDSSTVDSLRKTIFEKYDTSNKQFRRSHQFYQKNIDKQRDRITRAIEQLRKDRVSSGDSASGQDSLSKTDSTQIN